MPAQAEIIKTFCCWPCKSKPLIMTAKIPKTGYVCGENIPVAIDIDNPTNTPIKEVKISLNLFATYFSQYPRIHTCVEKFPLAKVKTTLSEGVPKSTIIDVIRVPPTPPTCQTYCKIIQLTYELHIESKVKGLHGAPSIAIPITIGNVPLIQCQHSVEHPILQSLPVPNSLGESDGFPSLPIVDPIVNATAPYSPNSWGKCDLFDIKHCAILKDSLQIHQPTRNPSSWRHVPTSTKTIRTP